MTASLLLDEAGDASIATALMMSHHGFRRDLAQFTAALMPLSGGSTSTARLPAAPASFEQRWTRVWGPVEVGASVTPIPDRSAAILRP
jgi:hypothetical protein